LKMVAWLSGYEARREGQAALGIKGKNHGGIIPLRSVLSTNWIAWALQGANMVQRGARDTAARTRFMRARRDSNSRPPGSKLEGTEKLKILTIASS
jgi:hypothetical protein